MNEYLLFAGYRTYPEGGMNDAQGYFENLDDAVHVVIQSCESPRGWAWYHVVRLSDMTIVVEKQ